MGINKSKILALNEANAEVLVELITAPNISESLRISAMEKLTAAKEGQSFFKTMLEEGLTKGECPKCQHTNHWLVPEEELNQQGYVSREEDARVPEHTDEKSCPLWHEACLKKKVVT
jgi:phage FluMu protein Com